MNDHLVYEIPHHYANPVTGRAELLALQPVAPQLKEYPMPPPAPPRSNAPAGMPPDIAAKIREDGAKLAPGVMPLYAPLHAALKHDGVEVKRDVAYGPHERHRADVFLPKEAAGKDGRPLLLFVHGGGFTRGAKSTPGSFSYDNIGYWAAEHGLVGVTINYRLAPQYQYPAGAEDVARAVDWLRQHAREYGVDPKRVFVWGHSAGAAHVATYLVTAKKPPVAGAILLSGIYDVGDKDVSIWKDYYGEDVKLYPTRSTLPKLIASGMPMLVVNAELDPPDFVPDTERLVAGRKAAGKPTVALTLPNHSHLSESYAIGTADESLSVPILKFIEVPPQ